MVRRVGASGEWAQEALRLVEEADEHLAARCGGEEIIFVAFEDGCLFVPKMVTLEEDVVDSVWVTAVRTAGVVSGICSETSQVAGVKSMSSDELKGGGLVSAGLGCENP